MDEHGDPTPGQWAADPTGRHRFRFWDGREWTGHVFDGEHAPTRAPGERAERHAPRRRPREREREAEVEEVGEPSGEQPVARQRGRRPSMRERRAALGEQSFWTGAAAGGGFVAVIAILATVVMGGGDSAEKTPTTTRATTPTTEATTTTTAIPVTTLPPGRPPAEVRVQVLNGSGVSGAASEVSNDLRTKGYTIAGAGNASTRQGTIVQCNAGFESEAVELAAALGSGATVQAANTEGTTVPSTADCVVVLGTA